MSGSTSTPATTTTTTAPTVPTIPTKYEFTTGNGFSTYPKFNGSNYLSWKSNITSTLKALNQWVMVLGSIAEPSDATDLGVWLLRRDRCVNEIVSRIEEGFKTPVASIDDPARVWEVLSNHYGIKDQPVTEAYWVRIITQTSYDPETPIQEHYKLMLDAFAKQAEAGGDMTDRQFRTHFLNSLPEQYENYMLGLDSKVAVAEIVNQLKGSETRKELRQSEAAAFAARAKTGGYKATSGPKSGGGGGGSRKRTGTCRKCGQEGHWERDVDVCPQQKGSSGGGSGGGSSNGDGKKKKRGKGGSAGSQSGSTQASTQPTPTGRMFGAVSTAELASAATDVVRMPHIVDSGASDHWLPSRAKLHNYRQLETPISIETAGGKMYARGVGDLHFAAVATDGKEVFCILREVKWVPQAQHRMLSFGRLMRDGYKAAVSADGLTLQGSKGNGLTVHIPMHGNVWLWQLRLITPTDETPDMAAVAAAHPRFTDEQLLARLDPTEIALAAAAGGATRDWFYLHRAMGHLNLQACQKLHNGGAEETPLQDASAPLPHFTGCASCLGAKQSSKPHPPGRERAEGLLDVVHMDIFGPAGTEALDGSRYGLVLVDDKSRIGSVEGLRQKSDALSVFQTWKAAAELSTGRKVRTIICDNAKEFVKGQFAAYCAKEGIRILPTVPYSPEGDGIAERRIRVLVEGATAMLLDAGLEKKLWLLATKAKSYLLNRSPTRANARRQDAVRDLLWQEATSRPRKAVRYRGQRPDRTQVEAVQVLAEDLGRRVSWIWHIRRRVPDLRPCPA